MARAKDRLYRTYIAANVRRLRAGLGLTQEQLAEAAGLEPRYLQEIERARTNLSLSMLVGLAGALKVPPTRLFAKANLVLSKPGRPKTRRPHPS
jgi:transcriptional regulator with XRE-family HTH domain